MVFEHAECEHLGNVNTLECVLSVCTGGSLPTHNFGVFWLYKLNELFKLRLSGQNLLAADTVRDSQGSTWKMHSVEGGYRTLMATLEGRW